jgi:hypothetical protein
VVGIIVVLVLDKQTGQSFAELNVDTYVLLNMI